MNWTRFDDKKPKKGSHIFALGQKDDGMQWMWWGFYNPKREDGEPKEEALFWCKMPPMPIMPEIKKECEKDIEISTSEIPSDLAELVEDQT